MATGKDTVVLRGHENSVQFAIFSPDGSRILTESSDNTARIWDAVSGKESAVLRGHHGEGRPLVERSSVAFNNDGSRVVTTSLDNAVRIWDASRGSEIAALRGHGQTVNSVAFNAQGTRIVTSSEDKTARIWDVHFVTMSITDLVIEVCIRRMRGLTKLSRDEMRLAGYPEETPEIDVCAGVE